MEILSEGNIIKGFTSGVNPKYR